MTVPELPKAPRIEGTDAEGFTHIVFEGAGFNGIFGKVLCRPEGAERARVRIETGVARANPLGALHGGFLMAFLDQAVFAGPIALQRLQNASAVTLTFATQFVGAGRIDQPLDCVVEIAQETGKLLFLRGQMEQGDHLVLTFQATLRKLSRPAG